jgi:hypothetical protein
MSAQRTHTVLPEHVPPAQQKGVVVARTAVPPAQQKGVAFTVPPLPLNPALDPQVMIRGVRAAIVVIRPSNTGKSYDPKASEFQEFCQKVYPNAAMPNLTTLVTPTNAYAFFWYQAHREKKTRKDKKRKRGQSEDYFDHADFCSVLAKYGTPATAVHAAATAIPQNACGYSLLKSYISAVKELWQEQVAERANCNSWESISNLNVQDLKKWVQARIPALKRQNFGEKLDRTFSPYLYAQRIGEIESTLFERSIWNNARCALGSLRNRFCFLETTMAVLRGESLFKAELSDLLDLKVSPEKEPHPFYITVTQIPEGKTNPNGHTIFGRAMRNRLPEMCPIGAKAMYLMFRFEVTGEMNPPPDFTNNDAWFNIKLLVDSTCTRTSNTTQLSDQCYGKSIKGVCKILNLPVTHFVHIGRVCGPKLLEFREVLSTEIAAFGNWNRDTLAKYYSAQIPLSTLRAAAGFSTERGLHFNPRTAVEADEALATQIFPFVEECLASIAAAALHDGKERCTAYYFLSMLGNLRQVILQDVAIMMDEGRDHPLFRMPVFQCDAFKMFQLRVIAACANGGNNPSEVAQLDALIPGINERFGNLQCTVNAVGLRVEERMAELSNMTSQILLQQNTRGKAVAHHLLQAAEALNPSIALTQQPASPATVVVETRADTINAGASVMLLNAQHHLFSGHASATSMYNEWYGKASFHDKPCQGGIDSMENSSKFWRKHFSSAEQMRFSRLMRVVKAISIQNDQGRQLLEVLDEFDLLFGQAGSITKLIEILKEKKYIERKP